MTALAPRPNTASTTAAGLVDAAIDGDARAWEEICRDHTAGVRAVALARLRDPHAAEDVVQETFLRAWTRLHQVDDAARLGAWLKAIAANVAVDHVRGRRPTAPLDAARATVAPGPTHDEHVVAREEAAVLHQRLGELRDIDRRALWQRDAHGVSVGDLADELGMTAGSVRVLLTRARKRVRDGYGLVAVPLTGLLDRIRSRTAGLGDAVPVAIAAPVLVVAVAAGVALPNAPGGADTRSSVTVDPAPAVTATPDDIVADPAPGPSPSATVTTAPVAPSPSPTSAVAGPAPEPTFDGPAVDLGREEAGFTDEAPTDDDVDASGDAQVGPFEGLEVYLEDSGVGELGEDCLLVCP